MSNGGPATSSAYPADAWTVSADPSFGNDLLGEFVLETTQNLADAEAALLVLEKVPDDEEAVARTFRAFHTAKGVSAALGMVPIERIAHAIEDVLSEVRAKRLAFSGDVPNLALRSIDALRECIGAVQTAIQTGKAVDLSAEECSRLVSDLQRVKDGGDAKKELPLPRLSIPVEAALRPSLGVKFIAKDEPPPPAMPSIAPSIVPSIAPSVAPSIAPSVAPRPSMVREGDSAWTRIRLDRLDRLIDMVGELVIAQSILVQDPHARGADQDFLRKITHSSKIIRELQTMSLTLRMVPLRPTFQSLSRLVRDAAHRTGKEVEFETTGEETEIDKNTVEMIADPLIHMVRNAVDHGIETADERRRADKPPRGRLTVSAAHEGSYLVIRVADDGRGMDPKAIGAKAIERKLIANDAGMSEDQLLALVFEPGFSTRDVVSELSGRGVGMDVVKRAIEGVRGRIEIQSKPTVGTTFTIFVPLSLAITDGMVVRVGSERLVIPTVAIRFSFRPTASMLSTIQGRGELVRVRDESIPLFRIHHVFGIEDAQTDPTKGLVVVLDWGDGASGFLVDELVAQQQLVSKALPSVFSETRGIAGGTILGDGRVGLIVEPSSLVALARQTSTWRRDAA